MAARATYDQPLEIDTHEGEVVIVGPGATALSLTPQAAALSAERLAAAAKKAAAMAQAGSSSQAKPSET